MAEQPVCSFSIEITDIESRGSRVSVTTPAGLQAQFHDGDNIRGFVVAEVSSIYYLKYLGIDLIGSTSAMVQRIDGSHSTPRSFKHKEVFLWKSMTLAGTPLNDTSTPSRGSHCSSAVTSQGRIVQLNKGRHILPFELTLETGCTPVSVKWQNHSMPSQNSHNVTAAIRYKLKVRCQSATSSKVHNVAKQLIHVGGFEHSRENLKAMASKGSGKSKMGTLSFPLMDGQLTYAATLDARAYHLGETALLTLVIDNKLPHPVNGISVRFNNLITLLGAAGKASSSGSGVNLSLSSSSNQGSSSDDYFSESEVLSLMNERYTVKPNESVKKAISIIIPQTAFCTTKYTRSVNLTAFLDISINVQSTTPSVSEKNFQVPIYIINKFPHRENLPIGPHGSLSQSSSSSSLNNSASGGRTSPTGSPSSSFKDMAMLVGHKPPGIVIWTNDNEVSQCTVCSHDFTLLRRRHHCRSCGRVMCGKCGKETVVEELFGPKMQRLCSPCLVDLHVSFDGKAEISLGIDEAVHTISASPSNEDGLSPRRSSIHISSSSSSKIPLGASTSSAPSSSPSSATSTSDLPPTAGMEATVATTHLRSFSS